jgi:hypothetical protein
MQRSTLTVQRLVAVFLAGCILFNYPVIALVDKPSTLFGVPLVFAYLLLVWAGLIGLIAWVVERRERSDRAGG